MWFMQKGILSPLLSDTAIGFSILTKLPGKYWQPFFLLSIQFCGLQKASIEHIFRLPCSGKWRKMEGGQRLRSGIYSLLSPSQATAIKQRHTSCQKILSYYSSPFQNGFFSFPPREPMCDIGVFTFTFLENCTIFICLFCFGTTYDDAV